MLNRALSHFKSDNPKPEDLALVIEVSDSTLRFDLSTKADLCAQAQIPEYWVVDVTGRRIVVPSRPKRRTPLLHRGLQ